MSEVTEHCVDDFINEVDEEAVDRFIDDADEKNEDVALIDGFTLS